MKLFECIIDDGHNVFKAITAAKSKKELLNIYGGNGKFEKITDITQSTKHIDIERLRETLIKANYGKAEQEIICELVREHIEKIK